MSKIRFFGLDVHADTIAVAVAEPDREVRCIGVFPNRLESIRKLVTVNQLRACYEAGPTGYVLYWQLTALSDAGLYSRASRRQPSGGSIGAIVGSCIEGNRRAWGSLMNSVDDDFE